ncbi:ABC transporter substrate-binding protein [Streptomyces sp. NPDC005529]|uniref:ABC transporter substrate-binding protein n=1 Tax=unclassified Streptomyces TaxID=2593676 RepID=UPI00339DF539
MVMNGFLRIPSLAVLGVLLLLAGACSSSTGSHNAASVPGVTDTAITIGSHQPLTGTVAAGYGRFAEGAKAYFDYVNSHGGVHGRKIYFNVRDDAYNPANTPRVVRKLVEQDKVFAMFAGFGTAPHQAVVKYLNAKGVPDLFPVSGCPCWNNPKKLPYTFALQTDYVREGKILGDYVAKTFPGKKVAYFYQDDGLGQSGVAGLDKTIPQSSVVARESYQPGYNSVNRQMQAIARAKADVIICFSTTSDTALLRLAQQRSGNTAQLVVNYSGSDPTTLAGMLRSAAAPKAHSGANPLIQGIITDEYLPPLSATPDKWVQLVRTIHARYLPTQPLNRYTEGGVLTAYLFIQVLQQTGRNLTRESLMNTLKKGNFPAPGVTPLHYSPTSHAGYTGTQIGVIKNNAFVSQGKPLTTDNGAGPVVPYNGTRAQPAPNGIPQPLP